jgi:hypothetical protein
MAVFADANRPGNRRPGTPRELGHPHSRLATPSVGGEEPISQVSPLWLAEEIRQFFRSHNWLLLWKEMGTIFDFDDARVRCLWRKRGL